MQQYTAKPIHREHRTTRTIINIFLTFDGGKPVLKDYLKNLKVLTDYTSVVLVHSCIILIIVFSCHIVYICYCLLMFMSLLELPTLVFEYFTLVICLRLLCTCSFSDSIKSAACCLQVKLVVF